MRRPRRRADDSGFTLVELVVAMAVAGVLLAVLGAVTVQALRTQRGVVLRDDDARVAQRTMGALTRDLRMATAPATAPAFTVTENGRARFTTLVGACAASATPVPVEVTWTYDSTARRLQRTLVEPASCTGAAPRTTTRTVAGNVAAISFTYRKGDATDTTPGTLATLPAEAGLVAEVDVQLTVDADGAAAGGVPGTSLQNNVICPNL